jgi:hypothetical protein
MPDWRAAYVPPEKLSGYLLSEAHAVGKWKADLFRALGFGQDNAEVLERRLLEIAMGNPVISDIQTPFGTKYVIEGNLLTPEGRLVQLLTVWIVEPSDPRPRFVTAYPAEPSHGDAERT